jgi:hypothetical protein
MPHTTTTATERFPDHRITKGLRQFLDPEQQRDWVDGKSIPPDAAERSESLEQRFKYVGRD